MKTLYDGKTKTVLLNEDTGVVNLFFKDSATGENGYFDPGFNTVGGSVEGKGKIGLQISSSRSWRRTASPPTTWALMWTSA